MVGADVVNHNTLLVWRDTVFRGEPALPDVKGGLEMVSSCPSSFSGHLTSFQQRKVQQGLVPSDIVQIIGAEGEVVVNGGVHHCMSGVYLRA